MELLSWSDADTIDCLEKKLRKGDVVLAEGDTILGLLADVSQKGSAQLNFIKKRSKKPYLLLLADKQKALDLVEIDPNKISQIEKLMNTCWPGPVTMIFRAGDRAYRMITSVDGTIAIRVPDHAGLQELLQRFEGLFSTSANIAGQPVPTTIEEVESDINSSVACIVFNDSASVLTLPSTIIDCTGQKITVVREGAFAVEKLAEFL
jgi:L-threonylcarbamoyladenylate synthase